MNFIKTIEDKFPIIKNDEIRDILFLIGLSLIVFVETMTTTMFDQDNYFPLYASLKLIAVLLISIKLFLFDFWTLKDVLISLLFFSIGILVRLKTSYSEPFFWALLVLGARNIEFKKILKVYICEVSLIVIIVFISSMLGVIENLQYVSPRGIRNSFGINYPCDFAAYIFFILLSIFYLMKDKIAWWGYLFGLLIAYVLYKFTYARLDCSCIIILSLAFMFIKFLSPKLEGKLKVVRIILCLTIVIMFVLSILLSYYYNPTIAWMQKLNNIFSTRLALGKEAFSRLKVNFFGQFFLMVGNGGSTEPRANYFFLDNSFIYILFRYGIVFELLIVSSFVVSSYKRRYDLFFIVAIAIIAINATTEEHLAFFQYNMFNMALFACFADDREKEKEILQGENDIKV